MQKKYKIDFDPNDQAAILRFLKRQQSYGYALKEIGTFSGIMTFESTYDTVRYAIRKKGFYRNDCPEVEGWTPRGDIGPYRIFSTNDHSIADYPLEELSEKDLHKKYILINLMQLALLLLIGALTIWTFMSEFFSSTAALFEMQLTDLLEPVCLILSIFLIIHNMFAHKKTMTPLRNPSWFKIYVLPWILILVIFAMICGSSYLLIKSEDSHPATEVPFQAPLETAKIRQTLLGKILSAENEFMYIARSEEIAHSLYEEALTDYDNHDGRWFSPSFWNFNVFTELDTASYEHIDRAMLMDENNQFYDLETRGIMVLIDNRLYGIAFNKEATTAESILNQLNLE